MAGIATLYLLIIVAIEAIVAYGDTVLGVACAALLILILLNHYIWLGSAPDRRVLPVLALLPLLRLLSVAMPFRAAPHVYWYLLSGLPLLIAIVLTARMLAFTWASLGFRLRCWRAQGAVMVAGVPLSLIAYGLVRPHPLIARLDAQHLAVGAGILIVFVGLTEELLFRGLLLQATSSLFGQNTLLWNAGAFAATYIGSLSAAYVGLMALVGLFFAWCVQRTGSLWGVVAAHSVLVIGMTCIWPFVWR